MKPACEEWILVRKPLSESTVAKNVLKYGTGGLNIDGCRINTKPRTTHANGNIQGTAPQPMSWGEETKHVVAGADGRFPANLVLSHNPDCEDECSPGCAVKELDGQSGVSKSTGGRTVKRSGKYEEGKVSAPGAWTNDDPGFGDTGGASRFFYCAKASKSDRGTGNSHPTVKSTKLMSYLVKLITPPNGIVLDPFAGSGSTGVAALKEGFRFVGIEKDEAYFEIAQKRVDPLRSRKA